MKKNIYATLDLTKSLSKFKEDVTKLLELTTTEWNGITVKEREEKIRQAALILAGECIALLLYNLSQSKELQARAIEQTQGWWRTKTRRHGYRTWQILTVGNVTVSLKLPYVVERCHKSSSKRKSSSQGFCPFLRWLGMSEGVTPLVWSTIAQYGTISSSFATAHEILIGWGVNISIKRVERLTYKFTRIGLSLRQSNLFALTQGNLVSGTVLKDQRVVIAVDGGRTRIRVNKKGKRNSKTNRRGFTGQWIEPKLLTIYTVDEQGKKNKTTDIPIVNDGTYEDYQEFLKLLEMHLFSLGINQAKQVLLIADGAEWIWKHIPPLLERLSCPKSTYQLLDFYHVAEHLHTVAEAAFAQDEEQKKWFAQARRILKTGKAETLIEQINTFSLSASGENRKIIDSQINYLTKGLTTGRLNYAQISALKLPIGSGAVESLIRQVVNLRMKGNGKFWLKNHAEIMLHVRCQWSALNWNNFCNSILTSFIYPATAK